MTTSTQKFEGTASTIVKQINALEDCGWAMRQLVWLPQSKGWGATMVAIAVFELEGN
jgi:hypothetical protein